MNKLLTIVALLSLSACSTIVEGPHQELTVNTNPESASCDLRRQGESLGVVSPTPGKITVAKTKDDIKVVCNKPGYLTSSYIDHSGSAGATFGNIILGGLIGWGVDSATGSDNKYDSVVNISLPKK